MRGMGSIRGIDCILGMGAMRGDDAGVLARGLLMRGPLLPMDRTGIPPRLDGMPARMRHACSMSTCWRLWLARAMAARCAGFRAMVIGRRAAIEGRITRCTFTGGIGKPARTPVFARISALARACGWGAVRTRRCTGGIGIGGRDWATEDPPPVMIGWVP
jgi:hypothetical protein